MMSVYLDYNASAPVDPQVLDVMIDVYRNHFGNADSRTHGFGEDARNIVETARKQVASLLGVTPAEVFFTSGATESNNIALQGLRTYAETAKKKKIVTSAIEHKAILETVSELQKEGFKAAFVKPDATGRVPVQKILNEVTEHTLAVSLMHVNNETGIIQPVEQLGNELEKRKVLFHVDATQSCGKLVEEIKKMKYDMLSFSAHKLGGPQGVGVLVLRKKNYKFPPVKAIMYGGPQEHGIRPGTVPVALVAGCGKACEIAEQECGHRAEKLKLLKNLVVQMLDKSGLNFTINGDQNYCMDNTLNVCLHGVSSEALMISTKQYCGISNGSACTSKSYSPSYVLLAMGVPVEQIENSVRISWGADTDPILLKVRFSEMLSMAKKLAQ